MDLKTIFEEYAHTEDEDDFTYNIKEVINSLTESDRIIIYLYSELQSMRKVAKLLNISTATAFNAINDIREKIISKLYDIYTH
jgi:DNA-directed RNA polymerase specialized sigma subunit